MSAPQRMIGNPIAVVLAFVNWYLRYRTGGTGGVFPVGIWLSFVTVVLLVFKAGEWSIGTTSGCRTALLRA